MLEVSYHDVACRFFPCTLDGREAIWCHSFPLNLIQNWKGFKNFLEKFSNDKTPAMLLKALGNLKMEQKEKFSQSFNCILNIFPIDMKPHDSITIYYYTFSLPKSIVQFVKRIAK